MAGLAASAAVALFVLDEGQDVGKGEGLAALSAGQEVTVLAEPRDRRQRRGRRRRRSRREESLVIFSAW